MALAWLWILLAAALVLGPISYMMPTKRDRLLTRLRAQARLEGGLIDIDHSAEARR